MRIRSGERRISRLVVRRYARHMRDAFVTNHFQIGVQTVYSRSYELSPKTAKCGARTATVTTTPASSICSS